MNEQNEFIMTVAKYLPTIGNKLYMCMLVMLIPQHNATFSYFLFYGIQFPQCQAYVTI